MSKTPGQPTFLIRVNDLGDSCLTEKPGETIETKPSFPSFNNLTINCPCSTASEDQHINFMGLLCSAPRYLLVPRHKAGKGTPEVDQGEVEHRRQGGLGEGQGAHHLFS